MPPTGTYRVQLHAGFTFRDAAAICPYLADLGVSHLYCSPYLQAAAGSPHGYDVVDHTRLSADLGGAEGFAALVAAARAAGLGLVLDVVPNHMCVDVPQDNPWWWSLLAGGRRSPYADFFDVDWSQHGGRVLVPVLGDDAGEVRIEADKEVVYHDKRFPAGGAYELADWRRANTELNYRRFFDVTSLAAVRAERPDVFDATHALVVEHTRAGVLDGLRVDHPDGLADPRGYLDRLTRATGASWIVVEKILESDERLPGDWPCAGTTGYDALNAVLGALVDPAGEAPLTELYGELTGEPTSYPAVTEAAKRLVVEEVLVAEVERLLRAAGERGLRAALVEMLVAVDVYRAYVVPGEQPGPAAIARLDAAARSASARRPDLSAPIARVRALAVDGPADFVIRFQQTCGPVMAKGVEDTAFYRYHRFAALNEVGGDPGRFGLSIPDFHAFCARLAADWPDSMTTLSTHDTKRGEHVRARLLALAEVPDAWSAAVRRWTARCPAPDANIGYLTWQTLVGAWPLERSRASAYLEKASREAKQHTSWTDPDPAYDAALPAFVDAVYADAALRSSVADFAGRIAAAGRANALAAKLVQLTMPGVPDTYQGSEAETLTLVDPDNRRPVDYARLRGLLGAPIGTSPITWVTAAVLRLRREHPDWFGAGAPYRPVYGTGARSEHLLAFTRGDRVLTLATRLPIGAGGDWRATYVDLPPGEWRDLLTGGPRSGRLSLPDAFAGLPVALLVRS